MSSVYSCYATDPTDQRIKSDTILMQSGWAYQQRGDHMTREPVMVPVTTPWARRTCGKIPQANFRDTNCIGCIHDTEGLA
jgi:hypothetical protein